MEFLAGYRAGVFRRALRFHRLGDLPPHPRPRGPPRSVASPADPVGGRVSEDRVFGVGAGVASPSLAHFPLPQSRWAISDVHFGAILGIPIAFGLETRSFPK